MVWEWSIVLARSLARDEARITHSTWPSRRSHLHRRQMLKSNTTTPPPHRGRGRPSRPPEQQQQHSYLLLNLLPLLLLEMRGDTTSVSDFLLPHDGVDRQQRRSSSKQRREGGREGAEGGSESASERGARDTQARTRTHTDTDSEREALRSGRGRERKTRASATLSCSLSSSSYKPTTYACVACCVCSRCAAPPETNLPASGSAGLACKGTAGPVIALLLLSRRPSASSQIFPAAPAATRGRAGRLRASRRHRHELDTLRVLLQESESGLSGGRGKESAVPIGNP